jgi:hypothetical protein
MLVCRKETMATTLNAEYGAAAWTAVAAIDGATAKQALKHLPRSIPSPQQSSTGMDMFMLSHGVPADCAQALAAGPKASQKVSSTAIGKRAFTAGQVISRL